MNGLITRRMLAVLGHRNNKQRRLCWVLYRFKNYLFKLIGSIKCPDAAGKPKVAAKVAWRDQRPGNTHVESVRVRLVTIGLGASRPILVGDRCCWTADLDNGSCSPLAYDGSLMVLSIVARRRKSHTPIGYNNKYYRCRCCCCCCCCYRSVGSEKLGRTRGRSGVVP